MAHHPLHALCKRRCGRKLHGFRVFYNYVEGTGYFLSLSAPRLKHFGGLLLGIVSSLCSSVLCRIICVDRGILNLTGFL